MGTINFTKPAKKLSKEITTFLNEDNINRIAKETGFVQRERKLNGFKFLDMLLFTHFNADELSLNDLSAQLADRFNIHISSQAIDERFTNAAVVFFKTILEKILNNWLSSKAHINFTKYKKVKIKDSTSFQLPMNMKEKYRGSGGASSEASIRIQFEYDLKNGEITDLSLHPFIYQDMTDSSKTIDAIKSDELIIRDLGYISINYMQKIQEKSAFYLNRLHSGTNVYQKEGEYYVKIDFAKIQKQMKKNGLSFLDKKVYLGKDKFPTRMIIELLPQKKYEERIRKVKRKASKGSRNIGKNLKARIALNVFVTNTNIPAENIRILYTLRWQIELMFKVWKSIGEIHKVKEMKVERFEAYLFAKLIWIIINWKIVWQISIFMFNKNKVEISPYKLFKTLKNRLFDFRQALIKGFEHLFDYIISIARISHRNHRSEKKRCTKTWSYDVIEKFLLKS